jgi:hypothetical protein
LARIAAFGLTLPQYPGQPVRGGRAGIRAAKTSQTASINCARRRQTSQSRPNATTREHDIRFIAVGWMHPQVGCTDCGFLSATWRSHMKTKFMLMAAAVAASLAGLSAANAAGIPWGADQQETSAQMDNDLNVRAARDGNGEHRAYQTHRHDGTWR